MDNIIELITNTLKNYFINKSIKDIPKINQNGNTFIISDYYNISKNNNLDNNFSKQLCDDLSNNDFTFYVNKNSINIKMNKTYLCEKIDAYNKLKKLIKQTENPLEIIFDYPSPNIC